MLKMWGSWSWTWFQGCKLRGVGLLNSGLRALGLYERGGQFLGSSVRAQDVC